MKMTEIAWPAEDEAKLRKLWATGMSCAKIALEFPGRSRNAIIGKSNRLDLPTRRAGGPTNDSGESMGAHPWTPPARKPKAVVIREPKPPRIKAVPYMERIMTEPGVNAVLWTERKSSQCARITYDGTSIFDKKCCGNPRVNSTSWCEACLLVVASPPRGQTNPKPFFRVAA